MIPNQINPIKRTYDIQNFLILRINKYKNNFMQFISLLYYLIILFFKFKS